MHINQFDRNRKHYVHIGELKLCGNATMFWHFTIKISTFK